MSAEALFGLMRSLWQRPSDDALAALLPRDAPSLAGFYERFRHFVGAFPRALEGTVEDGALVRGDVIAMGPGSVIEAGAVVHASCRLILGAGSRVRAGAVLRDEVVVGPDSLIGVHCEVVRSLLLGPRTWLGHFVYLADSIVGRDSMLAGGVLVANSPVRAGREIRLRHAGQSIASGRTHLGALIGDGVRFGAATTVCPGSIVAPGLELPPQVVLHGTVDAARRDALFRRFFATWTAFED